MISLFLLLQTAVAVGVEPDNKLPYNEYYEYFGPDYTLHVEPCNMENLNAHKDMEKIRYSNCLLSHLICFHFQSCIFILNSYAFV